MQQREAVEQVVSRSSPGPLRPVEIFSQEGQKVSKPPPVSLTHDGGSHACDSTDIYRRIPPGRRGADERDRPVLQASGRRPRRFRVEPAAVVQLLRSAEEIEEATKGPDGRPARQ